MSCLEMKCTVPYPNVVSILKGIQHVNLHGFPVLVDEQLDHSFLTGATSRTIFAGSSCYFSTANF
jgi:hypothetical protein